VNADLGFGGKHVLINNELIYNACLSARQG
jgi:hypothetical protein